MNTELTRKTELFVSNRQELSKIFKFDHDLNCVVSSLLLTGAGQTVDEERMKEVRRILSEKAGVMSPFRSTIEMVVLSKMYMAADPESYLEDVLEVYGPVRGKRIIEYPSLVISSMTIVDLGRKNEAELIMTKTNEIIRRMRKEHPFLTDEEDLPFAVLLAMTEKDVDTIIRDMEECYNYLKKTVKVKADSNAIQGLSELIILTNGDLTMKCNRAVELFDTFAGHGAKYGNYYEFASLGALIGLKTDKDELVDTIIETADTLKANKGFGNWSLGNKDRLMFAAMIVSGILSDEDDNIYDYAVNNAVISSVITTIIVEQIMVMNSVIIASNTVYT